MEPSCVHWRQKILLFSALSSCQNGDIFLNVYQTYHISNVAATHRSDDVTAGVFQYMLHTKRGPIRVKSSPWREDEDSPGSEDEVIGHITLRCGERLNMKQPFLMTA